MEKGKDKTPIIIKRNGLRGTVTINPDGTRVIEWTEGAAKTSKVSKGKRDAGVVDFKRPRG